MSDLEQVVVVASLYVVFLGWALVWHLLTERSK